MNFFLYKYILYISGSTFEGPKRGRCAFQMVSPNQEEYRNLYREYSLEFRIQKTAWSEYRHFIQTT